MVSGSFIFLTLSLYWIIGQGKDIPINSGENNLHYLRNKVLDARDETLSTSVIVIPATPPPPLTTTTIIPNR